MVQECVMIMRGNLRVDNTRQTIKKGQKFAPSTVVDITAKAISASFCMMGCSDVTMVTIGASPPHFIICCDTSVVLKGKTEWY